MVCFVDLYVAMVRILQTLAELHAWRRISGLGREASWDEGVLEGPRVLVCCVDVLKRLDGLDFDFCLPVPGWKWHQARWLTLTVGPEGRYFSSLLLTFGPRNELGSVRIGRQAGVSC